MLYPSNSLTRRIWGGLLAILLAVAALAALLGGLHQPALAQPEAASPGRQTSAITAGEVITIGVAAALSGPQENIGWRQANSVHLAVNQVNAAGGLDIGGVPYTVTLVFADSMCNPTQAITAAQTLIAAGAAAVIGDTCSGAVLAAQPLYAAAGLPLLSPSASFPAVTDGGYTNTFRVATREDTWPMRLAAAAYENYTARRAAIIEYDYSIGTMHGQIFSDTFVSLGGTLTNYYHLTSTLDFTASLTAIQAEDAHVIYFPYEAAAPAALLARIAYDLGMADTPIVWDTRWQSWQSLLDEFDQAAGLAGEKNFAAFYYPSEAEMPGYAAFNAAYQAAGFPYYGNEAQVWGALAYDSANLLMAAIDRADSTDPAAIRDELEASPPYAGVVGAYSGFDSKGDVIPQWGDVRRSLAGEWLEVYPADIPAYDYSRMDEFNGTSLGPQWSWIREDPTHWSLTDNPGYLRITLQQTQTNWLVQEVPLGDFDIQTRLAFTPTENFEGAGLLLYQDDGNSLMLIRAFCEFGYPFCAEGSGIYFDRVEGGTFMGENFAVRISPEGTTYLRLLHRGNTYTAYASPDGVDWWLVGRHVMSPGISLRWMGLGTSSGNQPIIEIPADFDYFQTGLFFFENRLPVIFK